MRLKSIDNHGRKFFMAGAVLVIMTIVLFAVMVKGYFIKNDATTFLSVLTHWVGLVTLVLGFYFGANVWQKKGENNEQPPEVIK